MTRKDWIINLLLLAFIIYILSNAPHGKCSPDSPEYCPLSQQESPY